MSLDSCALVLGSWCPPLHSTNSQSHFFKKTRDNGDTAAATDTGITDDTGDTGDTGDTSDTTDTDGSGYRTPD